jgi:hypothetical protein
MKTCFRCENDKPRYELTDAAGIFCTFVCEDCEASEKAKFNPKIFTDWYDADQPEPHWVDDY